MLQVYCSNLKCHFRHFKKNGLILLLISGQRGLSSVTHYLVWAKFQELTLCSHPGQELQSWALWNSFPKLLLKTLDWNIIIIVIVINYCHHLPYQKKKWITWSKFGWSPFFSGALQFLKAWDQTANSKVLPRVQMAKIYL